MAVYDNKQLYSALQELEVIPPEQLSSAFAFSQEKEIPLGDVLLDRNLISDENLGKVIAELLSVQYVDLPNYPIDEEVLKVIPEIVARKQKIVAFERDSHGIKLAMSDPTNLEAKEFLQKKTGEPVLVYYSTERALAEALNLYRRDAAKAFEEIITESTQKTGLISFTDTPVIKVVDVIITYAYHNKASDIHIEPAQNYSLIRFRIDGVLHDITKLPLKLHDQVVTRVKVLSRLRTDEHQSAQDGKLQYEIEGETIDVRVSIVPSTDGEKVVMRLLSEHARGFSLPDLGLSGKDIERVEAAYQKSFGMLLATGPTGCGKTTTMYAILKVLNNPEVNIMTVEDPVEYDIQGVNQIQVNPKTNLTFATGLRSILRQDPDIILVGEIRDSETASIAVNAAMTGHLVLSTLHTNDAATTIPRLLEMRVEPFLIASTINVIVAQRLVRKICHHCRASLEERRSELEKRVSAGLLKKHFKSAQRIRVYRGKGCPVCHQTGYEGRIGIFEVLTVNEEVREAILERQDAATIRKIAIQSGMTPMVDDGIEKVKLGITTIDEIVRVINE